MMSMLTTRRWSLLSLLAPAPEAVSVLVGPVETDTLLSVLVSVLGTQNSSLHCMLLLLLLRLLLPKNRPKWDVGACTENKEGRQLSVGSGEGFTAPLAYVCTTATRNNRVMDHVIRFHFKKAKRDRENEAVVGWIFTKHTPSNHPGLYLSSLLFYPISERCSRLGKKPPSFSHQHWPAFLLSSTTRPQRCFLLSSSYVFEAFLAIEGRKSRHISFSFLPSVSCRSFRSIASSAAACCRKYARSFLIS